MSTGSTATLDNVTISSGSTYTGAAGTTTTLLDGLTNKGTVQVDGGGGANTILQIGNSLSLSGGGTVNLSVASGGGNAFLRGSGVTLTNVDNTIQGAGNIGDSGALALVNQAKVDANATGQTLAVNGGNGGITNTGLLEATNGGTLQLLNTVNNAGGNITTGDATSTVQLNGATHGTAIGGDIATAVGDRVVQLLRAAAGCLEQPGIGDPAIALIDREHRLARRGGVDRTASCRWPGRRRGCRSGRARPTRR